MTADFKRLYPLDSVWAVPLPRAASAAADDLVTEHLVNRWARFGYDRLYVKTADGTRLGYWGVKADQPVVEDERHREAVAAAVAAFRGVPTAPVAVPSQAVPVDAAAPLVTAPEAPIPATRASAPAPVPVPPPAPTPFEREVPTAPAEAAWTDLSLNRPG